MEISVTKAKGQLTELVRRAEAGDEIVLTRHGHAAVRLAPVARAPSTREEKRKAIAAFQEAVRGKVKPGPCAARSQDFLYDEDGLPR
jgi:prevent-host-death family protein